MPRAGPAPNEIPARAAEFLRIVVHDRDPLGPARAALPAPLALEHLDDRVLEALQLRQRVNRLLDLAGSTHAVPEPARRSRRAARVRIDLDQARAGLREVEVVAHEDADGPWIETRNLRHPRRYGADVIGLRASASVERTTCSMSPYRRGARRAGRQRINRYGSLRARLPRMTRSTVFPGDAATRRGRATAEARRSTSPSARTGWLLPCWTSVDFARTFRRPPAPGSRSHDRSLYQDPAHAFRLIVDGLVVFGASGGWCCARWSDVYTRVDEVRGHPIALVPGSRRLGGNTARDPRRPR